MKRSHLLCYLFVSLLLTQATFGQKQLTKTLSLYIPGEDGSNSGAVVWHPKFKRYYTSMIGNAMYPMAIFSDKGHLIDGNFEAGADLRGLWYNATTKQIEYNCYAEGGVGHYILNGTGEIINREEDKEGSFQPTDQSVGVYNEKDKLFVFPDENFTLLAYKTIGGEVESRTVLHLDCSSKKQADEVSDQEMEDRRDLRNTTVVYTGIKNSEYAVLNTDTQAIEFYDAKTGLMTDKKRLPESFATPLYYAFNFSYANGIWWFFNKDNRTWEGYK
jgi:hypothetical protein